MILYNVNKLKCKTAQAQNIRIKNLNYKNDNNPNSAVGNACAYI